MTRPIRRIDLSDVTEDDAAAYRAVGVCMNCASVALVAVPKGQLVIAVKCSTCDCTTMRSLLTFMRDTQLRWDEIHKLLRTTFGDDYKKHVPGLFQAGMLQTQPAITGGSITGSSLHSAWHSLGLPAQSMEIPNRNADVFVARPDRYRANSTGRNVNDEAARNLWYPSDSNSPAAPATPAMSVVTPRPFNTNDLDSIDVDAVMAAAATVQATNATVGSARAARDAMAELQRNMERGRSATVQVATPTGQQIVEADFSDVEVRIAEHYSSLPADPPNDEEDAAIGAIDSLERIQQTATTIEPRPTNPQGVASHTVRLGHVVYHAQANGIRVNHDSSDLRLPLATPDDIAVIQTFMRSIPQPRNRQNAEFWYTIRNNSHVTPNDLSCHAYVVVLANHIRTMHLHERNIRFFVWPPVGDVPNRQTRLTQVLQLGNGDYQRLQDLINAQRTYMLQHIQRQITDTPGDYTAMLYASMVHEHRHRFGRGSNRSNRPNRAVVTPVAVEAIVWQQPDDMTEATIYHSRVFTCDIYRGWSDCRIRYEQDEQISNQET